MTGPSFSRSSSPGDLFGFAPARFVRLGMPGGYTRLGGPTVWAFRVSSLLSLLPHSGERLAALESWFWLAAAVFGVLAPVSGFLAWQVGQYRGRIERTTAEREASMRRAIEAARPPGAVQPRPLARQVTPAQREKIVGALSGKPSARVVVAFVQGDADGQRFAGGIADALRASGWEVDGPGPVDWGANNPVGHGVVVKDGNAPPPGAILLWGAFTAAGIQMGALAKPEMPAASRCHGPSARHQSPSASVT